MKVAFDCPVPFQLAHGGAQVQIEKTMAALRSIGVETEHLRWWHDQRQGDLIHYFGVPSLAYMEQAGAKEIPVVITHLLTETCNRPNWKLKLQGIIARLLRATPGLGMINNQLSSRSLRAARKVVVGLEAERRVLKTVFEIPEENIAVIPLGLSDSYLFAPPAPRDFDHLITTGTITDRKRSVDLAILAHEAKVPILFVGKPYSLKDPYWLEFSKLIDGKYVIHEPHVQSESEMIDLLGRARGFVIFSRVENWCLSAHEAAACGLPVLLPDQKWSRERFGDKASYMLASSSSDNVERLRRFYRDCPDTQAPGVKLWSWEEVAQQLRNVYRGLLPGTS